ncbi:MAG TPA: alpha/beta fold hydrolase [Usitatibacter sp.]|jgi:pimeloyl-ACP methyl ester carboxylesterase|nr:alpha/beta fold hydrolase [Usitatibacter sp.]
MTRRAPVLLILPGFDGDGALRSGFVRELRPAYDARALTYPNRALGSLAGYCRYAAQQVAPEERVVLVAESFSGLVAARWAVRDPHVDGLVLCGAFASNPVWAAALGAALPNVVRFGAQFLGPLRMASSDPARRQWSRDFSRTLQALAPEVVAERLRLIATENVSEDLRALRIPVILLQFDGDLVVGPRARGELETVCHNARVIRHPGPHFALETQPRSCADALRGALLEIAAGETRRS